MNCFHAGAGRGIGLVTILVLTCGSIRGRHVRAGEGSRRVEDFSDFEEFAFRARGCAVILNDVSAAEIIRTKEETYLLKLRIAKPGIEGIDECLDLSFAPGVDCVTEEPLPQRTLTDREVASVRAVFSELVVESHDPLPCATCGSRVYSWDSVFLHDDYDHSCFEEHIERDTSRRLEALLTRLRAGSEDCNANGEADAADIASGSSTDTDEDGVPDECAFSLPFVRGDCNDDGTVDISDAVCVLGWLFLDGAAPVCVAVTNTNGDAGEDISDATYLLSHLFLGGPAPVPPYPGCGPGTLQTDRGTCEAPSERCRQ